jgi:acetyl-CoA carboxylase biotin carboxyl carrier protein
LDLKEIKELIALMRKNDLSVFKMESEGFKITLKKGNEYQPVIHTSHPAPPGAHTAPPPAAAPAPAAPAAAPPAAAGNLKDITSPMVGTFYGSPSPDAQPYVKIGQEVDETTVVCIIEAMKVMNEIKADARGTIVEIVAEIGKPVQFGQALFRIQPK